MYVMKIPPENNVKASTGIWSYGIHKQYCQSDAKAAEVWLLKQQIPRSIRH